MINSARDNNLLGRVGTAEEIAKAAVFLASDAASIINSPTVPVDGAVHAILAAPV